MLLSEYLSKQCPGIEPETLVQVVKSYKEFEKLYKESQPHCVICNAALTTDELNAPFNNDMFALHKCCKTHSYYTTIYQVELAQKRLGIDPSQFEKPFQFDI